MYNLYMILGDSKPSRENEYDDWYVWVHVHDILRPRPVAVAAQCFRRTEVFENADEPGYDLGFLCLFENTDPEGMSGSGGANIPKDMLISSAANFGGGMGGGYFDTLAERVRARGDGTAVMVEWITPRDAAGAIQPYLDTRFAALASDPAIASAWLGKASDHQIFPGERPPFVALYRGASDDLRAKAATMGSQYHLATTLFRPISPRITRQQVLEPDAESAATAQAKRAAVNPMVMG